MTAMDFILRWVLSGVIAWCAWFLGMEAYMFCSFKLDMEKYREMHTVMEDLYPTKKGWQYHIRPVVRTIIWPWGLLEDSHHVIRCIETTLERCRR